MSSQQLRTISTRPVDVEINAHDKHAHMTTMTHAQTTIHNLVFVAADTPQQKFATNLESATTDAQQASSLVLVSNVVQTLFAVFVLVRILGGRAQRKRLRKAAARGEEMMSYPQLTEMPNCGDTDSDSGASSTTAGETESDLSESSDNETDDDFLSDRSLRSGKTAALAGSREKFGGSFEGETVGTTSATASASEFEFAAPSTPSHCEESSNVHSTTTGSTTEEEMEEDSDTIRNVRGKVLLSHVNRNNREQTGVVEVLGTEHSACAPMTLVFSAAEESNAQFAERFLSMTTSGSSSSRRCGKTATASNKRFSRFAPGSRIGSGLLDVEFDLCTSVFGVHVINLRGLRLPGISESDEENFATKNEW